MEKIVIKVWRGCVEEVYSTSKDIEVEILDLDDCIEDDHETESELPPYQVY